MAEIAYKYQKDSGEFLYPVERQESPLEPGVFLQPGNSLMEPPPPVGQYEAAVAANGSWTVVPDHRGRTFYAEDGTEHTISELGDSPESTWKTAPPELPTPPITVTPWQFRKALNQMGLRQQVEDAVAASPDQDLKDGWEFATAFIRTDPLVVSMGQALGKTDEEMDQLFALAATI